jgi:methylenetetrahydrofolate dehydrogenase (NADP+) / methenyltetrahydrofolate cyclohydrolase
MAQIILDGSAHAGEMETGLKARVATVIERSGRTPVLATILVGDDPSSRIYVKMKGDACARIGLEPRRVELPGTSTTEEVLAAIDALNADADVFGILLQHPVPAEVDERACFDRIAPEKDVDGVTSANFGKMALGEKTFASATPGGIMKLLARYGIAVAGKRAVVVGRSAILGKPVAMLLLAENATVTICHSRTEGLADIVRGADIVVAAVGKREFVRADWIREGAVIIDAGYHPGKQGDVERAAYEKASAYTPVPGGVGPMTIATLMCQTVEAAERSLLRK